MKYSRIEKQDLFKAWAAISLAFGILLGDGTFIGTSISIVISAFTAGVGFLGHELAHKYVAQKYGCWAEFRSQDMMLLVMIGMSFLGFIFAAPGAVLISGQVGRVRSGKISAAGPLASLGMGILFLLGFFATSSVVQMIMLYGFTINTWLGLFNLIPFGPFDGKKIKAWSEKNYFGMVAVAILLFILSLVLI